MRFLPRTGVMALLASNILGHPLDPSSSPRGVQRRAIDFSAYTFDVGAEYTNNAESSELSLGGSFDGPNYVDTATALVREMYPDADFRVLSNYQSGNGIGHVVFKQTVHGFDVETGDLNVNVREDGSILSLGSSFYTGTIPAESPLVKRDQVDPVAALRGCSDTLQLPVVTEDAVANPQPQRERYTITGSSGALADPEARLVYVQTGDSLVLSWRLETDIGNNWLLSYADAVTPENIVAVVDYVSDASYNVYPWGVSDPEHGERALETDPWRLLSSEFTWHGNGSACFNTTRGNNANAQANFEGDTTWIDDYRPDAPGMYFDFPVDLSAADPATYADASVTQLFYTANVYHDLLYVMGFDEVAGNFEANNSASGGIGGDAVTLNTQDGSGVNNANFATGVDGQAPRMRMYIWDHSTPVRDSSFDAGVVIHEYTHGLSTRLTGGPANSACLTTTEAGGLGEGWGDFFATAILLKANATRNTNYPMGSWISNNPRGIRAYLYSTDMTTNPMVYTTANGKTGVHFIGTIWATMLYEVLWNFVEAYGLEDTRFPTYVDGVPTDGRFLLMQLVVDAMKLQPCRPNFITARDAILDADTALTDGVNHCIIWKGFAKRGLGINATRGASTIAHHSRVDSYDLPTGVC